MQIPRWELWFFLWGQPEQSVLRFVLVPSQGYSSACGRTAMETLGRVGTCRLLLPINTLQVLGVVFNLQFEMWVKSVDEMMPHELIPCWGDFIGSLPSCPEGNLTDEISSPQSADGAALCSLLSLGKFSGSCTAQGTAGPRESLSLFPGVWETLHSQGLFPVNCSSTSPERVLEEKAT